MLLHENALGRLVPPAVNGLPLEAYQGLAAPLPPAAAAPPARSAPPRRGPCLGGSLHEIVQDAVPDGGWVSFPHYYRDDGAFLALLLDALRRAGRRGVHLLTAAFFPSHADLLRGALQDGTVAGFEANLYGPLASDLGRGALAPWTVVNRSHGGRTLALETGARRVDLAVAPVPVADPWGNANGVEGPEGSRCGPLGLFDPDARFARRTALVAARIHPGPLVPASLGMAHVDHVILAEKPWSNARISSGTTHLGRLEADPDRQRIAQGVLALMEAAGIVRPGFSFQVGAGAGLLVLARMLDRMRERGVRAGFTMGGTMDFHVDLLEEGWVEVLLDGQAFEPSPRLFRSLATNPRHVEVSTCTSYSPLARAAWCDRMDVVVLGANEVDRDFHVNTLTGWDGQVRAGIGGSQDAAAGARLPIFALPLARLARSGRSAPCVRDRVHTVTVPGDAVAAVVTEEAMALNPRHPGSAAVPRAGLPVVDMDELVERALRKARALGPPMDAPEPTEDMVSVVTWRDGRALDGVRRTGPPR